MWHYQGKIGRWVDGDTVDVEVDFGFQIYGHMRFRLVGVDTPERGRANFNEAREMCERLHPVGSMIEFDTVKGGARKGKYGRYLIDLPDVAEALINSGLGRPYP